jgi:hypothetical protein
MNNPQHIAATFARETLITFPAIQALVPLAGVTPTQYKIFWEHVEDFVEMPYIAIYHISGGEENDTQVKAIDIMMKIVGVSGNHVTALNLQNAIHGLHRTLPVSTTYAEANLSGYEWVEPYATVRQWLPIFDRDVVQQTPVFISGGIYRFRLMRQEV